MGRRRPTTLNWPCESLSIRSDTGRDSRGSCNRMCNWKLIVSCVGLALAIVGAILGWAVFPNVIRNEIKNVNCATTREVFNNQPNIIIIKRMDFWWILERRTPWRYGSVWEVAGVAPTYAFQVLPVQHHQSGGGFTGSRSHPTRNRSLCV